MTTMTTEKAAGLTQAEQIAGYLKLTHAHYAVIDKHSPSPLLELRTTLANEMGWETLEMAITIKDLLSNGSAW